jgi:hypothetical protein
MCIGVRCLRYSRFLAFDLFFGGVLLSLLVSFGGRPLFLPVREEATLLEGSKLCAEGAGITLLALDFVVVDELPDLLAGSATTAEGSLI